jgi:hypothetical protein
MKILIPFLLFTLLMFRTSAQSNDELEIRKILDKQTKTWNLGNIDEFMTTYWQSDSLEFIGPDGITHGYSNILNRYKKKYTDTVKMGKLLFTTVSTKKLSPEYYFVIGKWHLKRTIGDVGGMFTLLFKKIKSKWVIVTDHSS